MTVTANTALTAGFGSTTTVTKTLTGVPAGATVVVGVNNRTNETTVISSIADDKDGTWTLNYVAGPVDSANVTMRAWLAYRHDATR